MSPGTTDSCCSEEYKAAYKLTEVAVRAANEVDVALKDFDIYEERLKINREIKELKNILDIIESLTTAAMKVTAKDWRGTTVEFYKIFDRYIKRIALEEYEERLKQLDAEQLKNLARNLNNKIANLEAAFDDCQPPFESLLDCTAKYEPRTISLNFTWSEDNTTGGDIRVGHLKKSIKCQAQLKRKTPLIPEDFASWFEYYRKSPKIGNVRNLVCTYEGEVQTYITVDEYKPFIFLLMNSLGGIPLSGNPLSIGVVGDTEILLPQFHDITTEMQGGSVTVHFDISWSRFRTCEPLKFNIRFDGEEKFLITCYLESTCFSRIDDLVSEANLGIKHIEGLAYNASYEWLGTLISDPLCRFPHKWTQKAEKKDEWRGSAYKYTLEINVESR